MTIDVRFWGVRGSCPASGNQYAKYGGHTSCVTIEVDNTILILDAGSGLINLSSYFQEKKYKTAHLFLTHVHPDHIYGLPFFKPIWSDSDLTLHIYAGTLLGQGGVESYLAHLYNDPYFPISLNQSQCTIEYHDLMIQEPLIIQGLVTMNTVKLNHPNGAVGYVVQIGSHKIAYITDTEHEVGVEETDLLHAVENADLMIYDASYTDEEFSSKIGWGHSTWQEAIRIAQKSKVKKTALFHHDPVRTDKELDHLEKLAKAQMSSAFAAKEGDHIRI